MILRDLDYREKHQADTLNILKESQGEFDSPFPTPRKVDLTEPRPPCMGEERRPCHRYQEGLEAS